MTIPLVEHERGVGYEADTLKTREARAIGHRPAFFFRTFPTPRPRRTLVVNLFVDSVRSDSDEPLLAGVPVIRAELTMEGRFFPLLYDPGA